MYKVIIAGTRDFTDYELLCSFADQTLAGEKDIEIVSGGARGRRADDRQWRKSRRA